MIDNLLSDLDFQKQKTHKPSNAKAYALNDYFVFLSLLIFLKEAIRKRERSFLRTGSLTLIYLISIKEPYTINTK